MLKDDFDCTFFTNGADGFRTKECSGICRLVSLKEGEEGMSQFLSFLKGGEIVVLDNYYFDFAYQEAVKAAGCTLVCVDDLHDRRFRADAVVSPCLSSPSLYAGLLPEGSALCLGRPLLRQPFLDLSGCERTHEYDFLICFGATDQFGLSETFARLLPAGSRIAVLGGSGKVPGADNYSALDAAGVRSLMMKSDAVICSASSVCFEALACGCPVYAGWYVDNQKDVYEGLLEAGLVSPLGYLPDYVSPIPFSAVSGISGKGGRFDGTAAYYRNIFKALSYRIVNYSALTDKESRAVWEARNSYEIRRWMFNSEPFSFESHCNFVRGLASNAKASYYAFFDGDRFAGSFDFHLADAGNAERGLFVAPDYMGTGFAVVMDRYMEAVMVARGVRSVTADVLLSNVRSLRYHEKTGYEEISCSGDHVMFSKKLF